jgi:sulfur transfer complex TusBCD TusB component (DsrH family)
VRRLLLHDAESELPPRSLLLRLFHEKMAYSLFQDGEYAKAIAEYDDAAEQTAGDSRGRLKVDGARALCRYMLGSRDEALLATEDVLVAAIEAGYSDVVSTATATANAAAIRDGTLEVIPYEVL